MSRDTRWPSLLGLRQDGETVLLKAREDSCCGIRAQAFPIWDSKIAYFRGLAYHCAKFNTARGGRAFRRRLPAILDDTCQVVDCLRQPLQLIGWQTPPSMQPAVVCFDTLELITVIEGALPARKHWFPWHQPSTPILRTGEKKVPGHDVDGDRNSHQSAAGQDFA